MRLNCVLLFLLVLLGFGSGCSMFDSTGATLKVINETTSPFINVTPDPRIETVLTEHFYTSPIEWNPGAWEKVVKSRYAVAAIYEDLKERRNMTGEVPFYAVVYTTEFISKQWYNIKVELDIQAKKEMAISTEASIIYELIKERIDFMILTQQRSIEALEKTMDGKVSDTMLKQYNDLFSALEPIINMVL